MRRIRHGTPATAARLPSRYAKASLEQSRSPKRPMISRARGPARFIAASPWVTSVSRTSMPQSASHHENHSSTAPAPLDVVVT